MCVGVDQARQDGDVAEVFHGAAVMRTDGGDDVAFDGNGAADDRPLIDRQDPGGSVTHGYVPARSFFSLALLAA